MTSRKEWLFLALKPFYRSKLIFSWLWCWNQTTSFIFSDTIFLTCFPPHWSQHQNYNQSIRHLIMILKKYVTFYYLFLQEFLILHVHLHNIVQCRKGWCTSSCICSSHTLVLYCHQYVNQYVPFNLYTCMLTHMFLHLKVINSYSMFYLRLLV